MRFKRNPSTRNTVKTATRQRMLFAGFCMAVALLAGIATFLLINFGRNDDAHAALGSNMGFENNLTEWTNVWGTWSSSSSGSYVRSGGKSAKASWLIGSDIQMKNTSCTLTTPATGTNYMVVTAYAKSNNAYGQLRLGINKISTNTTTLAVGYTTLTSAGFTKVTAVFPVTNNTTYAPVVCARGQGGTSDVYVDDVHFYTTTLNSVDQTAPNAPKGVSVSTSGNNVTLAWTNGTDGETGIDGVTIVRYNGTNWTDVALSDQTTYHPTQSTVGPTTVGSWKVVYQGAAVSSFTDATPSASTYTYLVYMRDKAFNYTSQSMVARAFVVDGSNYVTLSSTAIADGLYIGTGSTIVNPSSGTITLRSNGVANIKGTLLHKGIIANNGSINFKSGGLYKYDIDGGSIISATWETGSTCEINGVKFTIPGNLVQTFHHFKWNCDQVAPQDFPSGMVIKGDLHLINSGPGASERIMWFNGNMKISGNFYVGSNAEYKCRPGSYVEFNGTSEQTIQVVGSTCRFNAIEIDNDDDVKMLCNATLDSLCRLSIGQLKLNGYTFYHENNATIVKALGKLSTGLLTAVNSSYKYNLVYERGDDTDDELTISTTYLNDLTINIPSSEIVKLKKIAYVNGKLYLVNGKVQTDGKEVYVRNTNPSAVSYTNTSYVNGNLRRNMGTNGTYAFPVGTSTHQQCAVLNLNNLAGVSSILAFFKNNINGTAPSVWVNGSLVNTLLNAGYWTVTPDVQPTGGTYDITLYERGYTNPCNSVNPSIPNNLYYTTLKRANSSAAWAHEGQTIGTTQQVGGGTVMVPNKNLSSFSDFAIAYGNTVLPITLSAFNATLQTDETVRVTWTTSAEINNAYFSLERSVNGTDFEIINEQEGAGTSTALLNYSFTDLHPVAGTNYYRIKQVDFDGTSTYGPIRQVTLTGLAAGGGLSATEIGVYPNPSTGSFTFTNKGNTDITEIIVTDVKGQTMLRQTFEVGAPMKIDLSNKPAGIYVATFTNASQQAATLRLVVSH